MNQIAELEPGRLHPSPLLKAKQAADYLSVSVSTLNKLRAKGLIVATYVCGDARYLKEDLDQCINQCRNQKEGIS